jgi:hypothetical protein
VIVRVNRDNGRRPPLLPDPGTFVKEVDRAVQLQIERVEAARKRVVEQLSELEAQKPAAPGGAPARTATMVAARVQCIGRGTNIMLVRDNDGTRVSYDNGPEARISDLGTGAVLVSRIEPSNRIAFGFTKSDRNGIAADVRRGRPRAADFPHRVHGGGFLKGVVINSPPRLRGRRPRNRGRRGSRS